MSTVAEIESAIERLPVEQVREVAAWLEEYKAAISASAGTGPARKDFRAAIGSYYREYPEEPVRDSGAWLSELREGEKS